MRLTVLLTIVLAICFSQKVMAGSPLNSSAAWTHVPYDQNENWGILYPDQCAGQQGYLYILATTKNNHTRFLEQYKDGYHVGIDYNGKCPTGSNYDIGGKVLSIATGSVYKMRNDPVLDGIGRYIIMDYRFVNGLHVRCRYFHLNSVQSGLIPGSTVSIGSPIGTIGNSGNPTMPAHLHIDCFDVNNPPEAGYGGYLVNPYHGGTTSTNNRPPATPRYLSKFFSPALMVEDHKYYAEVIDREHSTTLPVNSWYAFETEFNAPGTTAFIMKNGTAYTLQEESDTGLITTSAIGFNTNLFGGDLSKWVYYLDKRNIFFHQRTLYSIKALVSGVGLALNYTNVEEISPFVYTEASAERKRYLREDRARQDLISSVRDNTYYRDNNVYPETLVPVYDTGFGTEWEVQKMKFSFNGICNGSSETYLYHATNKDNPLLRKVRVFDVPSCSYGEWQCIDRNDLYSVQPRTCRE